MSPDNGDAVMEDFLENVMPGIEATDDLVLSTATLSTTDDDRDAVTKAIDESVNAAIDSTGESVTSQVAADEEVDAMSVMSPASFHFVDDVCSLVSAESVVFEDDEFDLDSIPSLGADDDIPSPGPCPSEDRVEFDLDDLPNLGSNNEVGDIPSPRSFGDQDGLDSDSISSLGSEIEVEWKVETAPLDSVDCPVVSIAATLSPINVEEESAEVQDQGESHGFEPNSLDEDEPSEATTAAPERTKRTVPPLEFRRSARLSAEAGKKKVILPVGTLGSVFVNGKRRSARLSLF